MEKSSELPPAYDQQQHAQPGGYPAGYGGQWGPPPQAGQQYPPPPPGGQYGGQYPAAPPQYYGPPGQPGQQYVVVQQPVAYPVTQGPPPPNHMPLAIFVTLCCFWPTGIVALIKANDAKNAAARGDMAGANLLAQSAKSMIKISLVIGIISIVFMCIIIGLYFGFLMKSLNDFHDDGFDD